jgi:polyisoprenoid-binding protein YceI
MSILAEDSVAVIPAGSWSIDPSHSTVEFQIKHLGLATVKGRAPVVSGTIEGGDRPSIVGTVDVASITTFDETRDEHLRSPDFFDAARYPTLSFESTSVRRSEGKLVADGILTIRGVSKPVTLRGELAGTKTDPWGNERIGVDFASTIDRQEWGLRWNAPLPGGGFLLPDKVTLTASFSAVKAS